jgi:hypothetical protein
MVVLLACFVVGAILLGMDLVTESGTRRLR